MMRKFYILLLTVFSLLFVNESFAQTANTYSFIVGTGATLDPMTGATTIVSSGVDDTPSPIQNIGFSFVYEGTAFTQFSASPDGFIRLGSPAATAQFTNSILSTTNIPKLFPFWDDLATGTSGSVSFVVTGTSPNQVLKVQWFVTVPRSTAGPANATMQAWIYETTNVIEFRYGAAIGTASSASIGINGSTATNFISVSTTGNTSSTSTANDNNTAWPGNGTIYSFLPPSPCTTPPTGGTTSSSSNPACSGVNFNLSVTSGATGTGLTYQWESSPDGATWTSIGGATGMTLTTNQVVATWYRRKTTCSSVDGFSTGLEVTMAPATSCYCAAGATSTSFEKISNVTLNTINNNSSSTAGYEDFTAVTTTVTAGGTYPVSVSISGGFSSDQVIIFVDYNQDGDFADAGETVYTSSTGPGPHTGNIAIPVTALAGNTRMRVRMHDSGFGPNATSCGNSDYGQVEDYTVNIFIPPCTITCPANIVVSNDPGQCGAIVNYPAPTTSGVCGPVTTLPAPGTFFAIGTTTVTATEPGGGVCSFTVTVNDTQAPAVTCPANITTTNTPGLCGAVVNFTSTGTDNCPGLTVTSSPASGSLFPVGTTTVTSTARDVSGNSTACTFTVTITDIENPAITCPANIIASNNAGQCGAVVNYTLPAYTDNCPGETVLTQSNSTSVIPIQIACQSGGLTTQNSWWRAYNLAPLGLIGPFTVKTVRFGIESAQAASGSIPVTVNVYTSAGAFPGGVRTLVASEVVTIPNQSGTLYTATLSTPPTVPANAILCLEVKVPDGRAPVNHAFFIGSNNSGQTGPSYIQASDCGAATPTDIALLGFPDDHIILNASGVVVVPLSLVQTAGIPSGGTFPLGTTTNTYRVTDGAGNTASCSFDVTVKDTQLPAITCPGNLTVTTATGSCTSVVDYTVTSSDNCAGVTQVLDAGLASGSAFPLGVNTVTWKATDAAGNSSTCTFTVTVLDGQLPVITAQPSDKTACTGDNVTFSVTATNTLSYQWQSFNGSAWNNIAGATSSSYTVSNVNTSLNTNSYRVVVSGLCTIVNSSVASLYVNTLPVVQLSATPPPVLLPNQTTTITASTIPSGGSYVWLLNGSVIQGAGSSTLTGLGVDNTGTYRLRYTDANGCSTTSADLEVTAAASGDLFVYPNPNTGTFQVRYYNSANESATVNIYDSKGARIYQRGLVTSTPYSQIDVTLGVLIPSGIYLVEIVNGSGKQIGSKRIIIKR